jgi:hypothetical protein
MPARKKYILQVTIADATSLANLHLGFIGFRWLIVQTADGNPARVNIKSVNGVIPTRSVCDYTFIVNKLTNMNEVYCNMIRVRTDVQISDFEIVSV